MSDGILDKIMDLSQNQEKSQFSPQELVNLLLSLLSDREAEILRLRHGFNSQKPRTLDAIGQKFNLTRERVRQIEKQALKKIAGHKNYDETVLPFKRLTTSLLEQHGGLITKRALINKILDLIEEREAQESLINFLINNFITDIDEFRHDDFEPSLRSYDLQIELVQEVANELAKILEQKNKILEEQKLLELFKASEYYKSQPERLLVWLNKNDSNLSSILFSYLDAHNKFTRTPFNQWGLTSWSNMRPKRINGKIYLVMLAKKKPLHFSVITDLINQNWVDARDVQTATVHNELIADPRFVLIGRGIYGLKDWGYESGKVETVVEKVLKKATEALGEDEIVEQVKKKKMVKNGTIRLALKNKEKFEKVDGKYRVK